MRWLGSLVFGLMLLFSSPARAQSVKVADLTGTWVGGLADSTGTAAKATNDTLILKSDSTFRWTWTGTLMRGGRVAGDTVVFGKEPDEGGPSYRLTLKDQQLLVSVDRAVLAAYVKALGDSGGGGGRVVRGAAFQAILNDSRPAPQDQLRIAYVFKRVAASTPKP